MRPATAPAPWCASVLLLVAAGTHVPLIREHLAEAPYVGWLFIALSAVCLVLAVAIVLVDHPGLWVLAGLTCVAAAIAFVASRTIGLPEIGDDVGNWGEPLGFPAVASEVLMASLTCIHLRRRAWSGRPAS